jgi:hypothetical protein
MIFVGHERGTKAYRVYDPMKQYVHITHVVVFLMRQLSGTREKKMGQRHLGQGISLWRVYNSRTPME